MSVHVTPPSRRQTQQSVAIGMNGLLVIYECEEKILSRLSRAECIFVCVVFGHQLSEGQKMKYYRSTYLEDGVSIEHCYGNEGHMDRGYLGGLEGTFHDVNMMRGAVGNWIAMTGEGDASIRISWRLSSMVGSGESPGRSLEIRVNIVAGGALEVVVSEERWSTALCDGKMYRRRCRRRSSLVSCRGFHMGSRSCGVNMIGALEILVSELEEYNTADMVSLSASLYTCRPTIVGEEVVSEELAP